jgi:hypothetical protein
MKAIRLVLTVLLASALFAIGAPKLLAQTPSTGALTGTVTDPSGGVIAGATVTLTNSGTGQTRTTTTDSNGSYKFGLLPPGTYSVSFSASGFNSATVPSVTVNVTETAVLNRKLEVGAQTQQVTVEAHAEAIQTQNATNGGVVGSQEVTSLPLVSRNYTQIINLSPGVVSNVTTASSVGNGTVDVAANGARQNQNNYSMDGSSVVNYVSGAAGQDGSYPGIAIPNPDTIQEFKVQTSQYDASSGRNPGANVDVVTKTGTNQFHGDAWEFNRNNFFNANDFFYKRGELSQGKANTPQTLKQNTFGFTFGGPIKRDKAFFFGSYQGIRQINGMGTSGFAAGYSPNVNLMPWNDYADLGAACSDLRCTNNPAQYRAYLGSVFQNTTGNDGVKIASDGSNISNTAIAMLQAKGSVAGGYNQGGFYFPGAPATCNGAPTTAAGCVLPVSIPIVANEDQYMINSEYNLTSKNTLDERYMFQRDPQYQPFNCFITAGNCNPGAPVDAYYGNHVGELRLTSILSSSLVNVARFSFHRDIENNSDPTNVLSCSLSSTAYIIPMVNYGSPCPLKTSGPPFGNLATRFKELNVVPILDITGQNGVGAWSQGGNFSMISSNFIDTFQYADDISWNHGKHTIRAGFEAERIDYNNTIPASGRGELLIGTTPDFLTSSVGPLGNPYDPGYNDGTPAPVTGAISFGFGLQGNLTHYNRINAFDSYIQDDFKVSPKLTLNLGLRWEYDGFPDDISGQFANVWGSQLAKINTGPALQALGAAGTLTGFVVPSNFATKQFGLTAPSGASGVLINSNKTLVPGSPWHNFAPRLGLAWQPLGSNFVVRAGYGWFYDRIYGNLLIDNQLNLPPYSGSGFGPFPFFLQNTLHDPWWASSQVPALVWTPRYLYCAGTPDPNGACLQGSGLGYTSDSPQMANRLPLTQEYNLDLQYQFAHGWVVDLGYVGSHGIHLYNWSQNINVARLVAGAPNNPTAASGLHNTEMIATSTLPYNQGNPNPLQTNTTTCFPCGFFQSNDIARVAYLGFTPAGVATTNTNGDSLYNSLQAQLKHQFANGLLLQVAYTWSKAFTNVDSAEAGSGINPPGAVYYGSSNSNDPLDLAQQYGLAAFNRPQRVVISYVYNFPYKNQHGFEGKLMSGWSLSGVTTVQDGLPFTITDSGGNTIYGAGTSTALLASPGACNARTGNCKSTVPLTSSGSTTYRAETNWLNTSAFTQMCTASAFTGIVPSGCNPLPANSPYCIGGVPNPGGNPNAPCGSAGSTFPGAGTGYGNSGIGTVMGPGQFNFDMALAKDTKVTEWGTLQFRVEAFNIFNHPQFDPPFGNNVDGAQFGVITATSVTPRVIQFGLKFLF